MDSTVGSVLRDREGACVAMRQQTLSRWTDPGYLKVFTIDRLPDRELWIYCMYMRAVPCILSVWENYGPLYSVHWFHGTNNWPAFVIVLWS